jgi:hypothetical protein
MGERGSTRTVVIVLRLPRAARLQVAEEHRERRRMAATEDAAVKERLRVLRASDAYAHAYTHTHSAEHVHTDLTVHLSSRIAQRQQAIVSSGTRRNARGARRQCGGTPR